MQKISPRSQNNLTDANATFRSSKHAAIDENSAASARYYTISIGYIAPCGSTPRPTGNAETNIFTQTRCAIADSCAIACEVTRLWGGQHQSHP